MKKAILFFMALAMNQMSYAQQYTDFLGAGHQQGITVTTSHNQKADDDGSKSIDGFPVENEDLLADAARFLAQATLGYDEEMLRMVAVMGYEPWLEEQFSLEHTTILRQMIHVSNNNFQEFDEEGNLGLGMYSFRSGWWENAMKRPDILRHRINYALSQIMVTSAFGNDLFEDFGHFSADYYDVLGRNSFGNYRDLLSEVSLHPMMGLYLNHMNNPKSDPANNIHPDENYAREVMQLFSIGLYELNPDGSRKRDGNGQVIPTYDNSDIREFAKIFTGWGDGNPNGEWADFGNGGMYESITVPMRMYEQWHEPGEKKLLNGQVVPAGQTGQQDFAAAMDNLFNHSNVGPFIGKALIQLLVSANPSPAYVNRVTQAFNNGGQGGRGDLKAVIKAILLDPEARDCDPLSHPTRGKLREPILRYTHFMKAFNATPVSGTFNINLDERWYPATGQIPLYASSVFNFYLPEFQPNGPIASQDLVAPVFQIHHSSSSVGYINEVNEWTFEESVIPYEEGEEEPDSPFDTELDLEKEYDLQADPAELVRHLNVVLAAGQMSSRTQAIITNAISQITEPEDRLYLALYLVMISPDFAVLK